MIVDPSIAQPEALPTPGVRSANDIVDHLDRVLAAQPPEVQSAVDHAHAIMGLQSPSGMAANAPETPVAPSAPAAVPAMRQTVDAASGGPSAIVAAPSAGDAQPIPTPKNVTPSPVVSDPASGLPLMPPTSPSATAPASPASPSNPLVDKMKSQVAAGPGWHQIHNPFLKTLAAIGDTVGSGLFPEFSQFVPGTSAHHQQLLNEEKGQLAQEQKQQQSAAQVAHTNAEVPLVEAQTDEAKARTAGAPAAAELQRAEAQNYISEAEARKNPDLAVVAHPVIDPDDATRTPRTGYFNKKTGAMTYGPEVAAAPVNKTPTNEMEKFFVDNPHATSEDWEKFKASHPKPMEWSASDAAILHAVGGDPAKPETQTFDVMKKFADLKKEHIAAGADHGVTMIDPQTHQVVRLEPGQVAPVGALTPQQMGQQNAPTTQQRNVAAQAQLVHEQMPEVLNTIDRMKDKIGPVSGRWNEFMQGKVGMDDPDMAALRSDLLMMSSAVALMHARGRLPENLREEFDHAINAPKQTAANLKAVLGKIDQWSVKGMEQGGHNPQPAQAAPARPSGVPANYVFDPSTRHWKVP